MNVQLSFNVVFVIYSTLAGIIGALGMIFVINLFSRFAWTRVNIIKALGSLFGRPPKQSLTLGIIFHLIAGMIFAMFYSTILLITDVQHPAITIIVTTILGFLHGIVASLIFVVGAVLSDPEGEIRKVQFSGGPVYFFAHIIYGFLVGVVLAISPLLRGG